MKWRVGSPAIVTTEPTHAYFLDTHTVAGADVRDGVGACTGCCIHPSLNLIATASGERNFDLWEEEEEETVVTAPVRESVEDTAAPHRAASVNSLRIWRFEYRLQSASADAAMTEQ